MIKRPESTLTVLISQLGNNLSKTFTNGTHSICSLTCPCNYLFSSWKQTELIGNLLSHSSSVTSWLLTASSIDTRQQATEGKGRGGSIMLLCLFLLLVHRPTLGALKGWSLLTYQEGQRMSFRRSSDTLFPLQMFSFTVPTVTIHLRCYLFLESFGVT